MPAGHVKYRYTETTEGNRCRACSVRVGLRRLVQPWRMALWFHS